MKKSVLLLIQLGLLLVAGLLVFLFIRGETETVTAYRYVRTIEYDADEGYQIQPSDVKEVQVPKNAVNELFVLSSQQMMRELSEEEKAENKENKNEDGKLDTKFIACTVHEGEYVMLSHLSSEGKVVDPIEELGDDYRLITMPVSMSTTLAGEIKTGDYIDLLYTGKGSKENEETGESFNFTYTKLFMQEVLVYKMYKNDGTEYIPYSQMGNENVSQNLTLGSEKDVNGDGTGSGAIGTPAYMTLAVSVSQAEEIYARMQVGSISYVGRLDQSKPVQPLGYVVGEYSKIFFGQGNAETNGLYIDSDIENAVVADIDKESKE